MANIRVDFFHLASTSRPRLWSGIMHFLQHSQAHTARESIHYFFANEIRRDDVYLNYVHRLARRHHVPAVITFDQPLFWKASEIVQGLPIGHPMGHNLWLNYQYYVGSSNDSSEGGSNRIMGYAPLPARYDSAVVSQFRNVIHVVRRTD